ncbi:MAG: bifunctional proline dehydrogenase/L-glutamate gamma-semialdehyde dehydrogenase [Fuerstiella sp.]
MSQTTIHSAVDALLGNFSADSSSSLSETIQKSLLVARALQKRAHDLQTPEEKKQQMELDRMIQNPSDKVTLTALTDQAFRSETAARAAEQLVHILDVQGVPRFFSPIERTLLRGFQSFGSYLPGVTIPMVKDKMRHETANVIIPAEEDVLRKHLKERRKESVRMNVNLLGEAILGEEESARRLKHYLQALQLPEIEVMSVKISTIYSQISPVSRNHSIRQMCERMELLYRAAAKGTFQRADGTEVTKFVYLDMEEYRDLSLTAEVFMKTLDRSGMENIAAGIVLQAYIPDSFAWQQKITEWARQRVSNGGAPITIRIVKGANMEMERVEASLNGWPQAPFKTKVETDANYKRMVQFAMQPENLAAARPGIASHNLFDISYALVLATEMEALPFIQFEMLEGMANHQRRALHELTRNLLLYAPACRKQDFIHAIGYLVRRLDENTGEENFLRHAFNITVNSDAWKKLEGGFLKSFEAIKELPYAARRQQDRNSESFEISEANSDWTRFSNEPDTDFSLPQNSTWADSIILRWKDRCNDNATNIPLYVAGQLIEDSRQRSVCKDPSRDGTIVGRYLQATADEAETAIQGAKSDPDGWRSMPPADRHHLLRNVAVEIRRARADLMGAALAEGGKTLPESDPEVSEAIDFVEFYSATAAYFESLPNASVTGRGVVVVVSPWNFPIAIPCGGIAAALAAGNTVILKPASNTVLVAHELCECFYRAGVPRTALQLLPCSGGSVGSKLVAHPDVDTVILTGGTDTALRMLKSDPEMRLLAETGGKNATIVTAMADRDQAIKHVIQSAFGHCGQKCSATSLLLLEQEVFEDEAFRSSLIDAVESMRVGSAWETKNKLGPLIAPPSGDLLKGLKELEDGEEWALMPKNVDESPCIYSPGIKWNVQPGSYTHMTEFFGPLLGVMSFRSLTEAINIVNESGFGLTSGIESLDDREQALWLAGIRAGNLYVNRSTTGAIVLRQPFGGMGKSAFGPGIKAGGPNYVAQLMTFTCNAGTEAKSENVSNPALVHLLSGLRKLSGELQPETSQLATAIADYDKAAQDEFLKEHDHFHLIGQDNIRRYLPIPALCVRVTANDTWFDIVARAAAARSVGCRVFISSSPGVLDDWLQILHDLTEEWAADIEFIEETDEELIEAIETGAVGRIRYSSPEAVPSAIREAVIGNYVHIADSPVLPIGRVELMWYVQEQSVCIDYHRYGNLGARAGEQRAPVL